MHSLVDIFDTVSPGRIIYVWIGTRRKICVPDYSLFKKLHVAVSQ